MEWFQAVILGLVQGLTEFLPVSSSGHLEIAKAVLGVGLSGDLSFEVAVHAATVLATLVVFRRQILDLLKDLFKFRMNDGTDYVLKLVVSMIPVFIVGVFFKDWVEELFSSLTVVGVALMVTAVLLFCSDRGKPFEGKDAARGGVSWSQAFIVGLAQAVAVIPGLSRSGSTISAGLLCGLKRDTVAQFSFLMVIVPILGEAFLDLVGGDFSASAVGGLPLAAGFVSAFVSGLLACKVMIALVRKAKLKWFALYCLVAGVSVLVFL